MAPTEQPPARGCFGQKVALAPAFENDFDFSISASESVEVSGEIENVAYLLAKTREMRIINIDVKVCTQATK